MSESRVTGGVVMTGVALGVGMSGMEIVDETSRCRFGMPMELVTITGSEEPPAFVSLTVVVVRMNVIVLRCASVRPEAEDITVPAVFR